MSHPYSDLPPEAFWRTGVATQSAETLTGLWQPKHAFNKSHKIVTFGSCFAQHISRELVNAGYGWFNAEEAPDFGKKDYGLKYGYGVFSARTGNIYTAAQLRQWAEWAVVDRAPPDEVWQNGERFQDPFRPNIEPDGFASADEVLQSRAIAIERFGQAITQADWLIFTLGQTECWQHSDGQYYAMCPGTLAGTYLTDQHHFRNLGPQETEAELRAAIAVFRRLNPDLKILLTVSPVPMTATASGQHVLLANAFTKSTLRTVAASFSAEGGIDYFPSYELITTSALGQDVFDANWRNVSTRGVRMVMKHFRAGIEGWDLASLPAHEAKNDAGSYVTDEDELEDEIACEEQILDAFSR